MRSGRACLANMLSSRLWVFVLEEADFVCFRFMIASQCDIETETSERCLVSHSHLATLEWFILCFMVYGLCFYQLPLVWLTRKLST